jgi:hypothetical protein
VSGEARDSVRQSARLVIELDFGILVYPPETGGEPWRAVFTENGQRKYRQGATEAKLAGKLEKARERLQAGTASMERPGADLIRHYLDPGRLPAGDRWSRKHARTQRRLCERFAEPVIGTVTCQDIKTGHMQQIVSAAPAAGEGDRVHGMLSALVAAGIGGGYLASPRGRAADYGGPRADHPGTSLRFAAGQARDDGPWSLHESGVGLVPGVRTARFPCPGWRARARQADRAGTRRTRRTRWRTSPPAHRGR